MKLLSQTTEERPISELRGRAKRCTRALKVMQKAGSLVGVIVGVMKVY